MEEGISGGGGAGGEVLTVLLCRLWLGEVEKSCVGRMPVVSKKDSWRRF